jgi:hypothetical protein
MEMIQPRRQVELFYYELWNNGDETVALDILDPDFRFRDSLGPERVGPVGFRDYMRSVRTALADYQCIIDDLIGADTRASRHACDSEVSIAVSSLACRRRAKRSFAVARHSLRCVGTA